jgi:hypothetical protein
MSSTESDVIDGRYWGAEETNLKAIDISVW